jgi:predicted GH43/DUF377 family glycosyl hydrolase
MRRAVLLLFVTAACSEWPIHERDVAGTYVLNRGQAADTLMVGPEGRYRRVYAMPGQPVAVDTGRWTLETYHGDLVVRFSPFLQRWLAETNPSGLRRAPLLPGTWLAPPHRTLTGRIQLVVDEDLAMVYVRRGRPPRIPLFLINRPAQQAWMLGPFTKPAQVNPVITPDAKSRFRSPMTDSVVAWEEYATFNPAAVVKDGKVFLLYRAEDASGARQIGGHTSRLGLAESSDGLHFTRRATPVLYPDTDAQRQNEWPGGVEDPRIVESDEGVYVLTYTQWNRDVPRLAIATSRDLITWTKHGPAFAHAAGGKHLRVESKSGAILARVEGDRVIATRVNGKYWMYFGVPDLHMATSDNLIDWTPLEDGEGRLIKVLSPRPGYFDSWLVEAGPPALLTAHGIVVLYNAGNDKTYGDASLPARVYTAGQALFDARNPLRLIARTDTPFIRPTESYERTGQYSDGTTFVEGLVPFKGNWYLYYGTADSRVGVAVWHAGGARQLR